MMRPLKALAALALLGVVACVSTVVVAQQYFDSRGHSHIALGSADVIIVVSAGLTRDQAALDPFSRARVETGVQLLQAGVAPKLLMSGGYDPRLQQHLAEEMKQYAISVGAPEGLVLVEGNSLSTFENARFTLRVAREEQWERAVVVSDDFHLLRAWALFAFWGDGDDFDVVALAPADGLRRAGWSAALYAMGRETLALPYNVMKMAAQISVDAAGLDVTIR